MPRSRPRIHATPRRTRPACPRAGREPSWRTPATLVLGLALLLAAGPASGRTIAVPEDHPTIRAAMAAAVAGDIILVGCGTYREHDLVVKAGVSLWSGTLQPDCVTIDAQGRGRVLIFEPGEAAASVVGLTLRGGRSDGDGGAILCQDAAPRLARCNVLDSRARRGAGLYVGGDAAPVLEDCVIRGNTALLHGGGVAWNTPASGRLQRGTLEANRALAGGGLAVLRGEALVLDQVTVSDNAAGGSGGGVWVGAGAPELLHCLLVGNHGGLAGGAMSVSGGSPRLVSCTLADNAAETAGGGVLVRGATPLIDRTIVAFNTATAVAIEDGGRPLLTQTNLWGHPGGDWSGAVADQADQRGNFSADPLFCGRERERYDLRAGSPCLPGGRAAAGELIGALERGCP